MTKEEINKSEEFLDAYLGGNRNVSTLTWNHWVECLHDYGNKLQSENERLKAEREADIIKFAKWYSGMTEDKVKSAYSGYLSESQPTKSVDNKPLTECMIGRDSECNHPKCPVTDEDEKNGQYCTLPLHDYRQ